MNRHTLVLAIAIGACFGSVASSRAGTVTGTTASPASLAAGAPVSVTVTGSNPCGAANIDYGDGVAITYAITGLPTTQTHSYEKPGTYTITARGMGNCDGTATTKVTVTGPPPPPPPQPPPPPGAAQITAVDIRPTPGRVGEPVTIAVEGSGSCVYEVHYGDGDVQEVTGVLPQKFKHTYARADTFIVIVKPSPPCNGKFTQKLPIVEANTAVPRIARLLVSPSPADAGRPVGIAVEGTGTCGYTIDFGDGNSESHSAALPDRMSHTYPAAGTYELAVVAERPCTGSARSRVVVRGPVVGGLTGVEVAPNPVALNARASFDIKGTGSCRVSINYGDGNTQLLSGALPLRVVHVYSVAGRYAVQAKAEAPCKGDMRVDVEVRGP